MSAFSRIRPLAAALALLLFLTANAVAWTDKPMDNPEGPPIPKPQEVGDPDQPPHIVPFIFSGRVYLIHLPRGLARHIPQGLNRSHSVRDLRFRKQRGGNAR